MVKGPKPEGTNPTAAKEHSLSCGGRFGLWGWSFGILPSTVPEPSGKDCLSGHGTEKVG